MIEEQEQVDESGVASEAEEGATLVPNEDSSSEPTEDLQQEDSMADSGDAEEFAEWADEEDLEALAKLFITLYFDEAGCFDTKPGDATHVMHATRGLRQMVALAIMESADDWWRKRWTLLQVEYVLSVVWL